MYCVCLKENMVIKYYKVFLKMLFERRMCCNDIWGFYYLYIVKEMRYWFWVLLGWVLGCIFVFSVVFYESYFF